MKASWNWNGAEESEVTVIKPVQAVAVYSNEGGDVVIRQQDPLGEDDEVIIVPRSQLEYLIAALQFEHGKPE